MKLKNTFMVVPRTAAKLAFLFFFTLGSMLVAADFDQAKLAGTWDIFYSNGTALSCEISPAGEFKLIDKSGHATTGVLKQEPGAGYLLEGPNFFARITIENQERLSIKHYYPKSSISSGVAPQLTATGAKRNVAVPAAETKGSELAVPSEAGKVIHSLDELIAVADNSKPIKPFDKVDTEAVQQVSQSLRIQEGKEIELQFQPAFFRRREGESTFEWRLPPATKGSDSFVVRITANVPADSIPMAEQIDKGTSATIHGVIRACQCNIGSTGGVYHYEVNLTVDARSLLVAGSAIPTSAATPTSGTASTGSLATTPANGKKLVLAKDWNTPMQGGSATMDDLARLFGSHEKPGTNLDGDDSIKVYEGISYLTPIRSVFDQLKISDKLASRVLVACPGLPRGSFYYYSVDGHFEGEYEHMYLVVDRADQLVSVQLVSDKSQPATSDATSRKDAQPDWYAYNFINTRAKAMNTLRIKHSVNTHEGPNVFRVDSLLLQPEATPGYTFGSFMRVKERVRWYVPRPIVQLILECVQKSAK